MTLLRRLALSIAFALVLCGLGGAWIWASVSEEYVEIQNGDIVLRGTLLSPKFVETAPAVVLVHGSGEVTRKSMLLYAWLFAVKGYAALAYDKRGVGASDGEEHEWREFSFDDLEADAAAAYNFLRSQQKIDANKVGFFGASQGGWVVSLASTQVHPPAFIIMASASVSTVAEDRIFGREAQIRHAGFDETAVKEATTLIRADHEATRSGSSYEEYLSLWSTYRSRDWFEEVYGNDAAEPLNSAHRDWEKTILDFDPIPLIKRIDTPVLWIFGDPDIDRFSPVELSLDRVTALKTQGASYQIIQIDGVGHTLEPEHGTNIYTPIKIRINLVRNIYRWLDSLE